MLERVPSFTIISNSETLNGVLDAVNSAIAMELEAQGFAAGEAFTAKEILHNFTYKLVRVRPSWYWHVFTKRAAVNSSRS